MKEGFERELRKIELELEILQNKVYDSHVKNGAASSNIGWAIRNLSLARSNLHG